MTLKELKEIIKDKRIDRVAGFCNSYEQMFDRCCIDESRSDSVVIDTFEFEDEHDPRFIPVSEAMTKLLEMSAKHDDDRVIMTGLDNNVSNEVLFRNVSCAKLIHRIIAGSLARRRPIAVGRDKIHELLVQLPGPVVFNDKFHMIHTFIIEKFIVINIIDKSQRLAT